MGPRALGDALGIIRKKPAGGLRLSSKGCRYEFAEANAQLDEFLRVCRKFQNVLEGRGAFSDILEKVAEALSEAGQACTALHMADPTSAVRKAMLRKFVCGYLADGGTVDWHEMTMEKLRSITPDEDGHLDSLPDCDSWGKPNSASAWSMLILGRPDHGHLLSMWSWLFAGTCAGRSAKIMARALEEAHAKR